MRATRSRLLALGLVALTANCELDDTPVASANRPPLADAGGPYSGSDTIRFDGSRSFDPDGDTLTYTWDFGDGAMATGVRPLHNYTVSGSFTVTLTVTDARGAVSTPATAEAIINRAPVAHPGGPYAGTDTIRFDGSGSSDPDADGLVHSWAFGDGTVATGIAPVHVYRASGSYTVTLTVTDRHGASGVATTTATIDVVLVGAGDIASCLTDRDEATARLLDAIPGLVFTAGDDAYEQGSAPDYADCYHPTWGRHKERTYAALGNRDYDSGTATASFEYFGAKVGPFGKGYYSYDLGAWHIIVLNDNGAHVPFQAGSAQDQWLQDDLARSPAQCQLAIWHQPLFFSSNTGDLTSRPSRKILWDRLYAAGVDVVINGHHHHYERLAPLTPDGVRDDAGGIRTFVVGTGGESLVPPVVISPHSEVRGVAFGVLRMTLDPTSYDWEFIPIAGQTFRDSGSGTCH